ncbi:hypothetical protein [Microbacterium sp. BK668]|uniref:hypothetical protein n=1 Tax=Microbacterium sp. BK668 TaxID=2512118 RepID=UPI00105C5F35|nr:hypothetical protein [Microbacterium sp. BK668]TDN92403.1 hypothetical protein EV279_1924 [Microbacterium sp. BK668]
MKRSAVVGLVIAAVALVGLGLAAWWFLSREPGPEATARAYLDSLAAGDGARAVALLAAAPSGGVDLEKAFSGADAYPSDARIGPVEDDGRGGAGVGVAYTLDGTQHEGSLGLVEQEGGWRVGADGLGALSPQTTLGTLVLVGGVAVPAGASTALLPAVYPVTAAPRGILEGSTSAAVAMGATTDAAVEASIAVQATMLAQQQLESYARACAKPAQTVPANCGIRVPWAADLASLASISFRIEQMPQLALSPDLRTFSATDGIVVATATGITSDGAEASFSYRADDWALRGAVTLTPDGMELAVG